MCRMRGSSTTPRRVSASFGQSGDIGRRSRSAPAQASRHPDHRVTAELVRDACFVGPGCWRRTSQASAAQGGSHHVTYRQDFAKPTFVVDISDEFEQKIEAMNCYGSQFHNATQAGEVYPNGEPLFDVIRHEAAHYGALIRCRYGEPFYTAETMRVDDVMALRSVDGFERVFRPHATRTGRADLRVVSRYRRTALAPASLPSPGMSG